MKLYVAWTAAILLMPHFCDGKPELIAAPESLKSTYSAEHQILMSGAATNMYPRVANAFTSPLMALFDEKVVKVMDEMKDGLRYAFQTKNPWTWPIIGTGHLGAQTVLENLIYPGETVLIPSSGLWGERFSEMARRIGVKVINIYQPMGVAFTDDEIRNAIDEHSPDVVYIVNGESSTGVFQDVSKIGSHCRRKGRKSCLLIVDFVTTLGVLPVFVDKWKIDAAYSNSHKGLGCVAGFAPVTFGPRAVKKFMRRKSLIPTLTLDPRNLTIPWELDDTKPNATRVYFHTMPVLQFYALREALAQLVEETLEKCWERHASASKRFYDGIEQLDLNYFVNKPESRLIGTVTLTKPKYVKDLKQMLHTILEKYKLDLGAGLGPTLGQVIRVGIFGPNANPAPVDLVLKALKEGLENAKAGETE